LIDSPYTLRQSIDGLSLHVKIIKEDSQKWTKDDERGQKKRTYTSLEEMSGG
jgi:hypothetical protein